MFERRIREKVKIDAMQFGFMPGKETTDAIFTVRQMQEKYGCKRKKLYLALEKKHLIEYLSNASLEPTIDGSKEGRSGGMVGEGSLGDV